MLTNIISSNTASDYLLTNMFLYEVLLSNIPILLMSNDYLVAEIKKRNSCIEILINNSSAMNALASSNILKSVYLVNISTGTSTSVTYNSVYASQSLNNAILISVYTMCFGQFWYGDARTCSHIGITATVNNIGISSSSWTQWNTYPQDGNYRQNGFSNTYINTQFYDLSHELAASYSLMSLAGTVKTTGNLQAIFYYL